MATVPAPRVRDSSPSTPNSIFLFKLAGQALRYSGNVRAQWNDTPLVPLDRFSIGGRYTVRGFDGELILAAERGWLIRNDLGCALGNSGQEAYLGLDHGEVAGPSSDLLLGKRLTGAVLGLRGAVKTLAYDLFVGTTLGQTRRLQDVRRGGRLQSQPGHLRRTDAPANPGPRAVETRLTPHSGHSP